jgi:hypothetical protein
MSCKLSTFYAALYLVHTFRNLNHALVDKAPSSLQRLQRRRAGLLGVPVELSIISAELALLRPTQTKRARNLFALSNADAEQAAFTVDARQHFAGQISESVLLKSNSIAFIGATACPIPGGK